MKKKCIFSFVFLVGVFIFLSYMILPNNVFAEIVYTVTYDTDGGNEIESNTFGEYNTVTLPTPEKEGYTFQYWQDDNGNQFNAGFVLSTSVVGRNDITLTAIWSKNMDIVYTVTYDTAGGNEITNDTMGSNQCITLPTPIKEGYHFLYWKGNDNINYYAEEQVCQSYDLTLTALWEQNSSTDSSDENNSTVEKSENNEEPLENPKTGNSYIYIVSFIGIVLVGVIYYNYIKIRHVNEI